MENSGYEAADKPGTSRPILPENQRRGRKISSRKGKRLGTRRKALSRREQDMQQLQNIIDQAPEIREDRVAAAKQALQAGTLELRGEELAEKLLRDFLHKGSPEA
jgi:flagellar biosynthesis anti-sigma factor FlgM